MCDLTLNVLKIYGQILKGETLKMGNYTSSAATSKREEITSSGSEQKDNPSYQNSVPVTGPKVDSKAVQARNAAGMRSDADL